MTQIQMVHYFRTAPWQKRDNLIENSYLSFVAHMRAIDMCSRNYFAHVDPDGLWPNFHVRNTGYVLPDWYKDDSNQVESLAKGFTRVQDLLNEDGSIKESGVLDAWERSPSHHDHVTGSGHWASHTIFGVGILEGENCNFHVLITAPPEPKKPEHVFIPWAQRGERERDREILRPV